MLATIARLSKDNWTKHGQSDWVYHHGLVRFPCIHYWLDQEHHCFTSTSHLQRHVNNLGLTPLAVSPLRFYHLYDLVCRVVDYDCRFVCGVIVIESDILALNLQKIISSSYCNDDKTILQKMLNIQHIQQPLSIYILRTASKFYQISIKVDFQSRFKFPLRFSNPHERWY